MDTKAAKKLVFTVVSVFRPGSGFAPAAPIATTLAMSMDIVAGMLSQARFWFKVLGRLKSNVGIAKIPQYHIKQSLLSESDPSAASAARSCPPTAKTANNIVPKLKISRPTGPKRIYPASPYGDLVSMYLGIPESEKKRRGIS